MRIVVGDWVQIVFCSPDSGLICKVLAIDESGFLIEKPDGSRGYFSVAEIALHRRGIPDLDALPGGDGDIECF